VSFGVSCELIGAPQSAASTLAYDRVDVRHSHAEWFLNRRLGMIWRYLGALEVALKKSGPKYRGRVGEEHTRIMLVQTGGVCERVHTTGDTSILRMKYGCHCPWYAQTKKSSRPFNGLQIAFRKKRGATRRIDCCGGPLVRQPEHRRRRRWIPAWDW
jgi:hypothetical protein